MTLPPTDRTGLGPSNELRLEFERALSEHIGEQRSIVELKLRANPYRSSFAIHDVDIVLEDGTALELLVKNLNWEAVRQKDRIRRPSFLYDPRREIQTYRRILPPAGLETPICYGALADAERDRFWLLLERVEGLQLADHGDFGVWEETARRLARMHERLSAVLSSLPSAEIAHLLRYDGDFYRLWARRAQELVNASSVDADLRRRLGRLFSRYDTVVEQLLELPRTIVHGEFYSFNVLIDEREPSLRVCPVDWDMAALAPSFVDLAALIAGSWTREEKKSLALVYHEAARDSGLPAEEEFLRALGWCRLHMAVQWIGWSEQTMRRKAWRDWVIEALTAADELEL